MVGQFGFGKMNGKLVFISGFMQHFRVRFLGQSNNGIHFKSTRQRGQTLYVYGYHDFFNKKNCLEADLLKIARQKKHTSIDYDL